MSASRRTNWCWCLAGNLNLADAFIEAGLSGTDENRPQFKRMMAEATGVPGRYDALVVFSLSRFARDLALQIISYRQFDRAGVELLSITKPVARGSDGDLMRSVVGAFNQHYSAEPAKHTIRTMRADAQDGFYNGGPVPFGYRSVTVKRRGGKEKKRLEIVEAEAASDSSSISPSTATEPGGHWAYAL